ncbi:M14 family zinc carboxypeptidase [Neptunomonas sp. CHC150]|uniref:M14 family zinc carboxypeptidase n=1 Tax=Neptunomonas sp. CHC150 TaxID=2998324 RepID=UPI0025B280E5|nr:M14 family zinc carboxypeptidase [Neptunomonas sp. CHC150]MDN2659969.1 M14 family zinc carboxypeptidase [Neptunomonas sp. CHC150]
MLRIVFIGLMVFSQVLFATTRTPEFINVKADPAVDDLCHKVGKKLSSVSTKECLAIGFATPRFYSVDGLPIVEKHFRAAHEGAPKILFIGGIHGDEYSSVSVTFKWLSTLLKHHSGAFDWHFLPLANPDGLLQKRSSRVNANEVDLNRNFEPADGFPEPLKHWQERAKKRARYYPGKAPLSEPETQMIRQLIDEYEPTVIISVHAPHGIVDFDGDSLKPPSKLGPLYLRQLGTYPGSLGNYAWFVKRIPVMTIELPHAGIMPTNADISRMWTDLVRWVRKKTDSEKHYADSSISSDDKAAE